jgi:hypothetical protein
MKPAFGILVVVILCSFFNVRQSFLKKINIGKYSYSIYRESCYLHDNRWNVEYFVVYKTGARRTLCSAFLDAKRNDSVFISGSYVVCSNRLEFIEHYYYNKIANSTDSIKKTFYPDKTGKLILKQSIIFTDKQKITKKY